MAEIDGGTYVHLDRLIKNTGSQLDYFDCSGNDNYRDNFGLLIASEDYPYDQLDRTRYEHKALDLTYDKKYEPVAANWFDDDIYLNALIRVYLIAVGFLIFTGFAGLAVLYLVL